MNVLRGQGCQLRRVIHMVSQSNPIRIDRFFVSQKEKQKARDLCEEGRVHFESQNYRGSLKCLSQAFDLYDRHGDVKHQMIIGPLILQVCQESGMKEEEEKFIER